MHGSNVLGDKADFHAQRLWRFIGASVSTGKIGMAQFMRGKSQGGFSGLKFSIVP